MLNQDHVVLDVQHLLQDCNELDIPAIYTAVYFTLKNLHIVAVNLQGGPQVVQRAEIGLKMYKVATTKAHFTTGKMDIRSATSGSHNSG